MRKQLLIAGLLASVAPMLPVHAQAGPSAFTSGTRYDAMRRVTGTIAPAPGGTGPQSWLATRNSYDGGGRLVKVETGYLSSWQSEAVAPASWTGFVVQRVVDTVYDARSRPVREMVSSGGAAQALTQTSYDLAGRLHCTAVRMNPSAYAWLPASACVQGTPGAHGADRITRNHYDAAGQLLRVESAVGTALQQDEALYTYSPNGQRTSLTDGRGYRAEFGHDGHDRQVRWTFPSKTAPGVADPFDYEAYGYDAAGNRTSLRRRNGATITYGYDALNRPTVKSVPANGAVAGYQVHYGHDNRGLQTFARFGSPSGEGVTNAWDGFGRLASSTTLLGGVSKTLSYQYDAHGNRTKLLHHDGMSFDYAYDGLDRVTTIRENNSYLIAQLHYDISGRRASITRANGTTTAYAYDGVGRLSQLGHDLAGTAHDLSLTFAYNPASQLIQQGRSNAAYSWTGHYDVSRSYAANGLNQYTQTGTIAPTYDALANLTSAGPDSYAYNTKNLLAFTSGGATFAYDPLGRMNRIAGGDPRAARAIPLDIRQAAVFAKRIWWTH